MPGFLQAVSESVLKDGPGCVKGAGQAKGIYAGRLGERKFFEDDVWSELLDYEKQVAAFLVGGFDLGQQSDGVDLDPGQGIGKVFEQDTSYFLANSVPASEGFGTFSVAASTL